MECISSSTHTVIKRLSKYMQSSQTDPGRTPTISKMEPFVKTVNSFEPLFITEKGSMLHVAGVLDAVKSLTLAEAVKTFKS